MLTRVYVLRQVLVFAAAVLVSIVYRRTALIPASLVANLSGPLICTWPCVRYGADVLTASSAHIYAGTVCEVRMEHRNGNIRAKTCVGSCVDEFYTKMLAIYVYLEAFCSIITSQSLYSPCLYAMGDCMLLPGKVDELKLFCRKGKADLSCSDFSSLATSTFVGFYCCLVVDTVSIRSLVPSSVYMLIILEDIDLNMSERLVSAAVRYCTCLD